MDSTWCLRCCTQHARNQRCPGELTATGPERHGWRVNAETPDGIEAYGTLIAPSYDEWRARIMTYPNILWVVPGGVGSMKFVDSTPQAAERQAADFIREYCHARGYPLRNTLAPVSAGRIRHEGVRPGRATPGPAERKIRFLPVRFGVVRAVEVAGTGNLSETGMFIMTDSPVDVGTQVKLLLELENEPMDLDGVVRWARKDHHVGRSPGMGVQLNQPPQTYRSYVKRLYA